MRISDWSSDVCSSDLLRRRAAEATLRTDHQRGWPVAAARYRRSVCPLPRAEIGRAHVLTPVTNAHLVCRLLLEKKKNPPQQSRTPTTHDHASPPLHTVQNTNT